MEGGPPGFPQGFSCLVVLWILSLCRLFGYAALTRYGRIFPYPVLLNRQSLVQSATPMDRSPSVWPLPLSLATTYGISFDFSSWAYLDVSVQPVFPRTPMYSVHVAWMFGPCVFPHSEIPGSMDICSSPRLIAACHVLHRRLVPRHSPCALSNLTYLTAVSLRLSLWFFLV